MAKTESQEKIAEKIEAALLKKATGYLSREITKEYQINEGESVLVKKKVALKNIPPDITAAKLLMEAFNRAEKDMDSMTDKELIDEKIRLINLLKEGELLNES